MRIRTTADTMRDNAREWRSSPLRGLQEAAPLVEILCDELEAARELLRCALIDSDLSPRRAMSADTRRKIERMLGQED